MSLIPLSPPPSSPRIPTPHPQHHCPTTPAQPNPTKTKFSSTPALGLWTNSQLMIKTTYLPKFPFFHAVITQSAPSFLSIVLVAFPVDSARYFSALWKKLKTNFALKTTDVSPEQREEIETAIKQLFCISNLPSPDEIDSYEAERTDVDINDDDNVLD